ncbi:MAG: hypothetical protein IJM14_06890 [Lachnospiraceae bacterium]|nr:hypothetical protein [Lachnospiraceae bacterium]
MEIKKDENMNEGENSRTKVIMARVGLVMIAVFIIAMCLGMVLGSKEVMMASLFLLVFVPIIVYCFILVYDRTHGKSKRERKDFLEKEKEDDEKVSEG